MPNIQDYGSSLWPTPKKGGGRNSRQAIIDKKGGGKHKSSLALEQAVEVADGILPRELEAIDELPPKYREMFPTPRNSPAMVYGTEDQVRRTVERDGYKSRLEEAVMWPPTQDAEGTGGQARPPRATAERREEYLKRMALWRTPQARDWKNARNPKKWLDGNRQPGLGDQVRVTIENPTTVAERNGQLNADWVEALMGFPLGWTDLTLVDGQSPTTGQTPGKKASPASSSQAASSIEDSGSRP